MAQLTVYGQQAVVRIAQQYGLSTQAVRDMLIAVNNGGGTMAQFYIPELGGSGQWMQGGMTMTGDMFNHGLNATVNNLCNELASLLYSGTPVFEPMASGISSKWWPAELGQPASSGSQNNMSYAYFAAPVCRLALKYGTSVSVYDTLDHQISGVSQQQGSNNSVLFTSQYGTVNTLSLPLISGPGTLQKPLVQNPPVAEPVFEEQAPVEQPIIEEQPQYNQPVYEEQAPAPQPAFEQQDPINAPQPPMYQSYTQPVSPADTEVALLAMERLGALLAKGLLTQDEFAEKKRALLARI